MKKFNLIKWLWDSHEKQSPQRFARYAVMLIMLLTLGVGQMWGAWIGNSGIQVNDTWYRSSNNIDGGNWLESCAYFQDHDFGAITSLVLGGQYDTWDNGQTDACNWNASNGIHILIKKGSTTIADFKLSCYHHEKSGNNNVWKTSGGTNGCSDSGSWGTYTVDLSGYAAGEYTIKATWFSPSGQSLNNTANFTINPVVTFKANGGTGSDYTQTVTYNTNTALTANTFTKTGYDFAGWATSAGGSVVYANQGNVKLTAHTNLFAKWTAHNYTASNNIKHADGSTAGQYNVNYDATSISYTTAPSKTGYNLEGLYYESGLSNKIVNNDRSLRASTSYTTSGSKWNQTSAPNLYAKWTAKTYSITLNKDEGDESGSASVTYNTTALSSISHATRDGWNLVGYFAPGTGDQVTDASGNLQASATGNTGGGVFNITDSNGKWVYDGDLTLYAHWSKEYSVTYNANGGSGTMTDGSSPYEAGSNVTVLSNSFTRSGYSFTGWNTSAEGDGTPYAAGATISSIAANVTLYAQWSENDYTVTVNAGSNGSVASGSVTGHKDTKVTLPTATANTGYHFDTWTTTSGSVTYTNQTSATSAQVNGLTAAATVRADFAANTYSVVFNANGGTGSMSNEAFTYDAAAKALTSNSFTKSGYTFVGWATSAARANAMNIDYTNGQSVQNLTSTNGGTFNLYAVWAKKYYIGGRFQHDWEDGTSTTNEMTYDTSTGKYKFTTSKTVSELSAQWHNVSGNYDADQVFFIHTGTGKVGSSSNPFYTTPNEDGAGLNFETCNSYANALVLANQETTWDQIVTNRCVQFSNVDNLSSNVIIWWEPSTKKIWYEATTSLNTNYYLLGFGSGNWSTTDARRFKVASVNASTATVSVSLTAKTYTGNDDGFKLYYDTWYGNNGTMTRANCSGWVFSTSEGNCGITADLAGTYTFTLNLSTKAISVTYPTAYQLNYSIGSVAGTDGSISTSPSTSSGSYVGSGNSVTLTGPAAKTGYTWKGWYTNAAGTEGKIADESRAITVTMNADKTLYACYTENSYSTNVAVSPASTGSITTPTPADGKIDVSHHTGTSVTATANTNYVFDHWGVSGGGLTVSSTTANPATFNATSANGTITAYFEDQWCIKGDQWDSWSTSKGLPNTGTNTYSASFTLTKGQKYKFKVHDRKTNTWYGNAKDAGEQAMERGDAAYTTTSGSGVDDNLTITPDVTGTYTFSFNTSTKALTVTFPTAYTVTYGVGTINGSNSAISVSPSFTSGDYVLPETDITFSKGDTKDGYTWKGWYSDQAGSATLHEDDDDDFTWSATRTGNISVYACYNFITYDITYNLNGGSNPVDPAPASSFNVETSTITLPTPTRTGYTFNGWYANSDLSTGGVKTQVVKGTHEDQAFWAKWTPKNYTITLKPNGGSGEDQEVTATFDATAPDSDGGDNYLFSGITNPTKTGYDFKGWWTSSDEGTTLVTEIITKDKYYEWNTSYVNNSGLWKNDGNVTAYAKWTPATYTVTLDYEETGKGSDGANSSVTATYNAAMPSMGAAPVGATGYKFMGYFTEAGGGGTKYYNADGSSAKNWDIAENTTLYAHFLKSEITELTHEASIAKGEEVTIDVNPTINVAPEGYTAICWSLLYADTDNPVEGSHWSVAAHAEEGKPNQVRYTLIGLENGSYKIKAVYKSNASSGFDACSTGTTQNTYYSTFRIIGSNTITLRYTNDKYYDPYFLRENGSIEIPAMESVGVKAPEIVGWTFWKWDYSDGIHSECANTGVCNWDKDSINISANYDGTLTAMYKKKQMIYFNNTLGWEDVYVYFYNDGAGNRYWADGYGSGANQKQEFNDNKPYFEGEHGHMTRIAGTNIWYFDFKAAGYNTTRTKVAFANVEQSIDKSGASNDEAYFHNASVVYRTDFDATNLPMFVPINSVLHDYTTNTGSKYYRGYWMSYPDKTGYELRIYNKKDGTPDPYELSYKRQIFKFTGDKNMPMSVTVDLEANKTYGFKIYRTDGTYFGNGGTMTNGHSGDEGQAVWEFTTGTSNAGLTTTGAGYYTFMLSYGEDLSHNFNYLVGVRYPESSGDFRVLYKDNVKTNWRPSAIIPKATDTTIVSYFVRAGSTPYIKAQICSLEEDPKNPGDEHMILSWRDSIAGANLIPLCTGASDTITKYGDGVYNFLFAKVDGNLILAKVEPYTGNFYIRVDGAGYSNWDKYIADDHLMPYSDYSFNQATDKYSHYFTHYYDAPASESADRPNIKFVVANEYSPYISDTITQDGIANNYVDANGYICRDANIRFMYNYKTNEATRRYIDGAQESGSTFLVLIPSNNTSIYDAQTEGNAITQLTFSDNGNWIYEANVWAVPGTTYKLKAKYGATSTAAFNENGEVISYLKGAESGDGEYETLIAGSDPTREHLRLLYDFKTNRLVSAWLPSGTINSDHAINADVMFIREGQEDVTQVTFGNSGSISAIQNVYSVMRFNKWTLNNRDKSSHSLLGSPLSPYERALYWISFPYDVRLSDVFGFGTYGTHWIIEYYDGAYRAENGFWADSEANWKFVMPNERNNFVLKAGMGYILALDLDKLWCSGEGTGEQDDIWKNIQYGEIIFPGDITSIGNTSVTYNIPAHNCNITRNDRNIKDSHWNVIGVPTYLNTSDVTYVDGDEKSNWMTDGKPKYIYSWNPQDNTITATSAVDFTYHSMHAYMVQYYGDITFTTSTVSVPAAARRYENAPRDVEFRLALLNGEQEADNTFVRMSIDEDVTTGFEFGQDLTKEMNASKSNIYTLISGNESNIQLAANVLPMSEQTTVVPVGVKIKNTGDYTFAIPQGTSGVGITLVDTETGIRTSLSALEYTVNLEAGTYDNRFYLEISPIVQNPTDIENVQGDNVQGTKVRKVMVDGILYIVKDGKMFDAQGRQVK